jgi:hypothetical protein
VTADGTQYTLSLDTEGMEGPSVGVVMGTLSSGSYTIWLVLRGTLITAQVQRSQDGLFLRADGVWQSAAGTTAAQFTDAMYSAQGAVMIGGTWP